MEYKGIEAKKLLVWNRIILIMEFVLVTRTSGDAFFLNDLFLFLQTLIQRKVQQCLHIA